MALGIGILRLISISSFALSLQAASIVAYVEAPTLQWSSVNGVAVETFDTLGAGIASSGFASVIGEYGGSPTTPFAIVSANEYGGAGGTGQYFAAGTEANSDAPVTLTLNANANYFGFWWSAGDPNNTITFLRNGVALATFTTSNLIALLPHGVDGKVTAINGDVYNTDDYYGNPNDRTDPLEPFAYVDVIATGLVFNQIQFANTNSTGFESDNHRVAAGVLAPPAGDVIVQDVPLTAAAETPEPSTYLLFTAGVCAFGLLRTRRNRQ